MRIYKSDGTYIVRPEDIEFGWNLTDIIIDEAIPNYMERNREIKSTAALKINHQLELNKFDESIDTRDDYDEKTIENISTSNIKISRIKNVIYSEIVSEGNILFEEKESKMKELKNIDEYIPSKTDIAKLIEPCSVESKMLLAVVHFAKYKMMEDKNVINLGNIMNSSGVKFLLNGVEQNDLQMEIQRYHDTKEENMLSLMMELILNDMKCDMSDIKQTANDTNCYQNESSDLGNSIESSNCININENENTLSIDQNCSGISSILDRSIEKICEETYDIRMQIKEMKRDFQADLTRVNNLITEAQQLEKHLREKKYLDELLHLLNGDLYKITSKQWPFKIFQSPNTDGMNLII